MIRSKAQEFWACAAFKSDERGPNSPDSPGNPRLLHRRRLACAPRVPEPGVWESSPGFCGAGIQTPELEI